METNDSIMNVFITCTPEFSYDKLDEIVTLLSSIPGELKFIKGKPLNYTQFRRLNPKFEDVSQIMSLTFEELFDLIQGYREFREIIDEDYIILVTSIRNRLRWFSAFSKNNIFIQGDEWDLISSVDSKFSIAHQCVENIFQSLIDIDIYNAESEPNIHFDAINCINDFCKNKSHILRKLQSANICESCYQRAIDKGVNDFLLTHIVSILEEIRREFVISKKLLSQTRIEKVVIDEKGNITIGDRIIKMNTLPKVMYINFLRHIEGIPSNKLCENKEQFEGVYIKLKSNPDDYAIAKMCCNKIKYKNKQPEKNKPTFETYRTRIKNALKDKLGVILANFYAINLITDQNNQSIFKVPLSPGQFEIHPKFSK